MVIEPTATGYSAYSPDLDGCVATGKTRDVVERETQEAIEFHLEGMVEKRRIPDPRAAHICLAMLKYPPFDFLWRCASLAKRVSDPRLDF